MRRENEDLTNIKVGISHGDINGIGYEIIIKSFEDKRVLELLTPVVYGISKAASYHRKTIKNIDFNFNLAHSIGNITGKKANLIDIFKKEVKIDLGTRTANQVLMLFS
jgi:4-hydroxy-L-threonine phosphate dehydrogenase PdxA